MIKKIIIILTILLFFIYPKGIEAQEIKTIEFDNNYLYNIKKNVDFQIVEDEITTKKFNHFSVNENQKVALSFEYILENNYTLIKIYDQDSNYLVSYKLNADDGLLFDWKNDILNLYIGNNIKLEIYENKIINISEIIDNKNNSQYLKVLSLQNNQKINDNIFTASRISLFNIPLSLSFYKLQVIDSSGNENIIYNYNYNYLETLIPFIIIFLSIIFIITSILICFI